MAETEGVRISFFMILLIVLILVAVISSVAVYARRRSGGSLGSAEKKLDDRFAKGEISAEEYRQRLQELDETRGKPPEG
ncbi:MAG TPA: SHOCT domain-containing protein [Planococcus sp. (in: firmicutes)]|nr:SHOCT domain-containing protein [Planococcus sp. (in: firmicutes)]